MGYRLAGQPFASSGGPLTSSVEIGSQPTTEALNWIDVLDEHVKQIMLNLRWRDSGHTSLQALCMFLDMQANFDTTAAAASGRGLEIDSRGVKVGGANALTNYGVVTNARNGDSNFSLYSSQGILRNDGLVVGGSGDFGPFTATQLTIAGGRTLLEEFRGTTISPAALSANTNDWSPTGLSTATHIRVQATTPINITGLDGGNAGRELTIVNVGANAITFTAEDVASTVGRRFKRGFTLAADQAVKLLYDAAGGTNRWRDTALR